jgi:hypothetical protein
MQTRQIPLSQGKFATVSAEDFRRVMKHKWCLHQATLSKTYAQSNMKINGKWKRVLLHRFLMNAQPGQQVDHKDRDGLNNTRENLRFCTHAQNLHNSPAHVSKNKTSRFKGVSWSKVMKKWHAQIMVSRKYHSLGYFHSEEEAARAYDDASRKHLGEFASVNFNETPRQEARNALLPEVERSLALRRADCEVSA